MNPNGQRFWLLADAAHWHSLEPGRPARFDPDRAALRLASEREPPVWNAVRAVAEARLEVVPQARDAYGTTARWSETRGRVVATGALPGEVDIYQPTGHGAPTDLAMGYDGVLYLAIGGRVTMLDRRGRRESAELDPAGFRAWRLAPSPTGGTWALDRQGRRLGRVAGTLWPRQPAGRYDPEVFRPVPENPDPPRLRVLDARLPAGEVLAAIACSPAGRLALLSWAADGTGLLRVLDGHERLSSPTRLLGARFPFSFAWITEHQVALLMAGVAEAPAYPVEPGAGEVRPAGDLHPLRDHAGDPFLHGVSLPPHYPTLKGTAPLHRLSLPAFARRGGAMNRVLLDSGAVRTVWDRLYLEAMIPEGCGIVVRLAATDEPAAPLGAEPWHEHRFGSSFPPGEGPAVPRGAWLPQPSELPFHPGLLRGEPRPGRAGLFTVLIQRAGHRVRSLRGRYLWVKVELIGSGLASPELTALRAYAPRFSYVDHYLPELYRESVFPPDADLPARDSTRADFLERFLANFEAVLTPLEDRVAHAYLLTDPRTAPSEALDWLASWIGLSLEPAHSPGRRRAMLRAAPDLARWHGTARGLALALDLATSGAVRGGEVVIVEDFRLRRTFATILGADLEAEDDPLLGGIAASGNSYVGDTLFLGDETRRELLALFAADVPLDPAEGAAVAELFERLAHRVTVLVHQEVEPQDLGLIRRVVAAETPAHVEARVVAASQPLIVGMASLVGVDTYLGRPPAPRPVRVERSRLGTRDFLLSPASLDPRLGSGTARLLEPPPSARPLADAGEDFQVGHGRSFDLDGSGSSAAPGRQLDWYRWTLRD